MKIAVVTGASSGMGREFVYAIHDDTVKHLPVKPIMDI